MIITTSGSTTYAAPNAEASSEASLRTAINNAKIVTGGNNYTIYLKGSFTVASSMPSITNAVNLSIASDPDDPTGPFTITQTMAGALFTFTGGVGPSSLRLQNIIIDGDSQSGSLENMSTSANVYISETVIKHYIITPSANAIINATNNSNVYLNAVEITNCHVQDASANQASLISLDQSSRLFFYGEAPLGTTSIHHCTTTSSVAGDYWDSVPLLIAKTASMITLADESSIYGNHAESIIKLENSALIIQDSACIHDNEVSKALIAARRSVGSGTSVNLKSGAIAANVGTGIRGSAIVLDGMATMLMEGGLIEYNKSASGNTGVVLQPSATMFTMTGGKFRYNESGADGAAIHAGSASSVDITGGEFVGNKAGYGGAIYLDPLITTASFSGLPDAPLVFARNIARGDGGAVYVPDYSTVTKLGPNIHCSNNRAGRYYNINSYDEIDSVYHLGAPVVVDSGLTATSPFDLLVNNADFCMTDGELSPFVRFISANGGKQLGYKIVIPSKSSGGLVPRPVDPAFNAGEFIGWFTELKGGVEWDFSTMKVNAGTLGRAAVYGMKLFARFRVLTKQDRCLTKVKGGKGAMTGGRYLFGL